MKIKQKLFISITSLSLIIIAMFGLTIHVTSKQKDDGLVINFAGRQRMLSQMIVKEVLYYAMTTKAAGTKNKPVSDSIRHKVSIFDKTLNALKDSGNIPLSLKPSDTATRECPKAQEPTFSQFEKVKTLWTSFQGHLDSILNADTIPDSEIEWVMQNNILLVTEINVAVDMLQTQSESNVRSLITGQVAGVIAGVVFMLFSLQVVITILKRLGLISRFAVQLGNGDLTVTSGFVSADELGQIGADLDTMISKLKRMISELDSAKFLMRLFLFCKLLPSQFPYLN